MNIFRHRAPGSQRLAFLQAREATFLHRKARLACLGSQPCNQPRGPAYRAHPTSHGPRFGFVEDREWGFQREPNERARSAAGQQTKAATKAQHEQGERPKNPPPHPARRPGFPTFSCPTNFRNCSKFPIAPAATASSHPGASNAISREPGKRRDPLTA